MVGMTRGMEDRDRERVGGTGTGGAQGTHPAGGDATTRASLKISNQTYSETAQWT